MSEHERMLPHSLEAEKAVLGAILLNDARFSDACEQINASHFYRKVHRRIFEAMERLAKANQTIDLLTIKEALTAKGHLDDVGGPSYIAALTDVVPSSSNVLQYARIVREKAELRRVIFAGSKMLDSAYDADGQADEILDQAEQALFGLQTGQSTDGLQPISRYLGGVLDQLEAWSKAPGAVTGVPSGFLDLDAMTRGFHPSTLVIIAARPAMGKSALVLNIAQHVASTNRVVAFFSLEMSEEELALRSVAGEAGIDGHRMQRGRVHASEWGRLSQAIGTLSERQIFIDASPFVTVFDIKARCRRLKLRHGLDLVIVDYTQLMVGHEKHQNRTLEIGAITRGLKALSKDLRVPVIALSQLNRDLERRDNKRPLLSDLRDSGALEQDADVVIFIYRDEVYHEDTKDRGVAELIISKHRNGPIGTVKVGWRAEETRFVNYVEPERYEDRRLPMGDR